MWRQLVAQFYLDHEFRSGVDDSVLVEAERVLGHELPSDLRTLLAESDGIFGKYELGLIWPIDRIVATNLEFRSLDFALRDTCMPFEPLIFFADAGTGDQFAFPRVSSPRDRDVFVWNHEDDSRTWVAPDLGRYLEWWSDGRIKT